VHQQQGQQDVQEEAEEEQVDSSIINVSTNSDNMAPGDEEDNQNIIINSVFIQWNRPEAHYSHLGMDILDSYRARLTARVCGPILPPKMQCERFLSQFLPAFATSVLPMGFPILPKFQFIMQDSSSWKALFSSQSQFVSVATNATLLDTTSLQLEHRQVARRLQFGEQDESHVFTTTPDIITIIKELRAHSWKCVGKEWRS
jgi:hypothetical protein